MLSEGAVLVCFMEGVWGGEGQFGSFRDWVHQKAETGQGQMRAQVGRRCWSSAHYPNHDVQGWPVLETVSVP